MIKTVFDLKYLGYRISWRWMLLGLRENFQRKRGIR
jgi:hypothetical protein